MRNHRSLTTIALIGICTAGMLCADVTYTRSEECSVPMLGSRRRQTETPFLFAEVILKYGMYQNFLHYYIERPLFFNRGMRNENVFENFTKRNFIDYEIPAIQASGLDGFGTFCVSKGSAVFSYLPWLEAEKSRDFMLLPEYLYGERLPPPGGRILRVEAISDMIKRLKESEYGPKTRDGRLILGSWNSQVLSLEEHKRLLDAMRTESETDKFCLTGELFIRTRENLESQFRRNGGLTEEQRNTYRKSVQETLDLFGGLQMCVQSRARKDKGDFPWSYSTEYFKKERRAMLQDIFSRRENEDKLLGCVVYQGYVNPMLGFVIGEYGTSSLRHGMDESLKLNPDYIILFEWNEANENTSFQPSVYNGRAVTRIMRYYSQIMKGKPVEPMPGDDLSRPNAIVSYRPALKVGETIYFELLNVPDGGFFRDYAMQLELLDASGRRVHAFPAETMKHDKLHAVTYSLPSEQFAGQPLLQPRLLVDGKEIPGLGGIRLASTMCVNYKELRQAIRELATPEQVSLKVTPLGGPFYQAEAVFSGKEPLASLELLEDEDEVAAVDVKGEFDFEKNQVFYAAFTTIKGIYKQTLNVSVEGCSSWKIRPAYHCNVNFGKWRREGGRVQFTGCNFSSSDVALLVEVPKEDVARSTLSVEMPGKGAWRFPLNPAWRNGVFAAILDNPLRLDIRRMDNLPDVPCHINDTTATLKRIVRSESRNPLFHLRAIAKNGALYRTRQVAPNPLDTTTMKQLDVFSDFHGKVVKVSVPEETIPVIDYRFNPCAGDAILNDCHPQFDGQLGGGFPYMEAFWEEPPGRPSGPHPPAIPGSTRAPKWVRDQGRWILEFNGGNYINFGNKVMPLGAFTVECDIMPERSDDIMVLFRHSNRYAGSIVIVLDKNVIRAEFHDKVGKIHRLNSSLAVPAGRWSTVKVGYNLSRLTFEVNGQRQNCPMEGRAFLFKSAIFGGHNGPDGTHFRGKKVTFYRGKLRRLVVRHDADVCDEEVSYSQP